MKKRLAIVHFIGTAAVLFALLFQSVHEIGHLRHELAHDKCHHEIGATYAEFTHAHETYDACFICHFALGNYVQPEVASSKSIAIVEEIPYFFSHHYSFNSFSGNADFLRGPPILD